MRVVGTLAIPEAAPSTNPPAGYEHVYTDPSGQVWGRTSGGILLKLGFGNPMTATGDLILGGASGAPGRLAKGAGDTYLGVDTGGTVGYRTMASAITNRMNFVNAADLWTGAAMVAGTFFNVYSQDFVVGTAGSTIQIDIKGGVGLLHATTAFFGGSQVQIDNSAQYKLGGVYGGTAGSVYNALTGTTTLSITGLAVGTHNLRLRVIASQATSLYVRSATMPEYEPLSITVNELTPGGPTGPIGPSAQTAGGAKVQLAHVATSDLWGGTSFSASTWTNFTSAFSFTVDDATSNIEIAVRSSTFYSHTGSECMTRLLIDGATIYKLGGFAGGTNGNPFAGVDPVWVSGLAAGAHTATVQIFDNGTPGLMYCRAASQPDIEHFAITIVEHKQGGLSWTYQGAWSAASTYAVKDVVTLNGTSYVAIAAGTNHQPDTSPTFWALMAAKGADGAPGAPIMRLNATATADVWNATGGGAGTYTVDGPRTFTVGAASSVVEIDVSAQMEYYNSSANTSTQTRVLVDATAYPIGGAFNQASNGLCNPFSGTNSLKLTGLAPGSHSVTVQIVLNSGGTLSFQPAGLPQRDFLRIQVTEYATTFSAWLYRGAWSAATAYVAGDVVTLNGVAYLAIASSTNQSPDVSPTYWVVIVAPGSMTNPMTTAGDVIVGGSSGAPARIAKGGNGTVFGVDGSGTLGYTAKRQRAKITHNATQSVANSSFVAVLFNTLVVQSIAGMFTTNSITAVEAGWYQGEAFVEFSSNNSGDRRMYIQHSVAGTIASQQQTAGTTGPSAISCPFGVELAAGEYIFIYVLQSAGAGAVLTLSAAPTLSMQKVA